MIKILVSPCAACEEEESVVCWESVLQTDEEGNGTIKCLNCGVVQELNRGLIIQ